MTAASVLMWASAAVFGFASCGAWVCWHLGRRDLAAVNAVCSAVNALMFVINYSHT